MPFGGGKGDILDLLTSWNHNGKSKDIQTVYSDFNEVSYGVSRWNENL